MGSLGFWEIVTLAVLALFIFGPERLPGMARSLGKTVATVRREANRTLSELKDSAGLDADFDDLAREARELRTSLTDVRRTATSALMGPVDELRGEVDGAKADVTSLRDQGLGDHSGGQTAGGKAQSGPGMADLSPTAAGAVPGRAPFDPDAT